MAEIVKNLGEAQARGLISPQPQKSEIASILSDVKGIIEGIKDLKGVSKPKEENSSPEPQFKQMNETKTEISNKTPIAILKVKDEEIEKLLTEDLENVFNSPYAREEMTLKELKENLGEYKELIKPEIKKFIQRSAKAEIEWK